MNQIPEEDEPDDEELGVAETYNDYMPSKCNLYYIKISPYFIRVPKP